VGFKFELKTVDGDDAGSFETAVPNWQTGDTLIAAGNVRYRVVSVIPVTCLPSSSTGQSSPGSSRSTRSSSPIATSCNPPYAPSQRRRGR